ncbi:MULTISPECIES: DotH/IcmK family type IV secretion protein [unclassified Legionella]|uniref:DotH/IcmK family type IV secretion protein n=1 Tax=unclassified Legionella TaxID=2622702 RepID=UPI00105445C2|nr:MULTISPECIES: DotH/IcmK family type IV secretion protein [unclassified Legionella]MDI9817884.1 DotH/IcmK family type IV secretion protein [Legionella sp. PL877]
MNKKKTGLHWIGLILILSSNVMPLSHAADQSDSAQQALQQLRLLQQRLAQPQTPQGQQAGQQTATPAATTIPAAPTPAAQAAAQAPAVQRQQQAPTPEADNELVDSQAFEGVTRQLFPLTPEQLMRLKQLYHASEYAQSATAGTPPKPTATSQFVNLSPGSTPPVIRLSQGFVSSLVFLDSTGAPWPISAYDLGDPAAFNIQWDKTGNTLMIQSLKLYTYGNLAVRLRGLNTPVMLTLIPGQKAVDYRVDLRVQGYGPNAKSMPMEEGIPPNVSDLLLHVLDGVPPPGSQRLTVSGGDARAWLLNDRMYVRTNLTILSPGWIGSMTSADGMHAYEMQKSPVLLVSWHGKVMQLKVEGL